MRVSGEQVYKIPYGGGFEWVSAPHYLGTSFLVYLSDHQMEFFRREYWVGWLGFDDRKCCWFNFLRQQRSKSFPARSSNSSMVTFNMFLTQIPLINLFITKYLQFLGIRENLKITRSSGKQFCPGYFNAAPAVNSNWIVCRLVYRCSVWK